MAASSSRQGLHYVPIISVSRPLFYRVAILHPVVYSPPGRCCSEEAEGVKPRPGIAPPSWRDFAIRAIIAPYWGFTPWCRPPTSSSPFKNPLQASTLRSCWSVTRKFLAGQRSAGFSSCSVKERSGEPAKHALVATSLCSPLQQGSL